MKNKILASLVMASLVLVNGAYAANKTGVTDSLNAGDSRVDLVYASASLSPNATFISGVTSTKITEKLSTTQFNADYLLGVTDRFNMGISLNLSRRTTAESNFTIASKYYETTEKYEGAGDPKIGAQYLLADKKDGSMGLVIYGTFSPATAASDAAVAEVKVNGVVTTAGVAGKSGNGYSTTMIGTTMSIPGNAYIGLVYAVYGEKSTAGVNSKSGTQVNITIGIENHVSDKSTVRPYVRVVSVASGYSGTTQIASYNGYDLGLEVINDVSKNVSLSILGEYNSINNVEYTYANSDKFSWSGTGYALGLRGMFFF